MQRKSSLNARTCQGGSSLMLIELPWQWALGHPLVDECSHKNEVGGACARWVSALGRHETHNWGTQMLKNQSETDDEVSVHQKHPEADGSVTEPIHVFFFFFLLQISSQLCFGNNSINMNNICGQMLIQWRGRGRIFTQHDWQISEDVGTRHPRKTPEASKVKPKTS